MKKYLLISEKPSLMRAVKTAYFNGNINKKMQVDFIALHGHVCTLAQPEDYKEEWKKWTMDTLPLIPSTFKHIPTDAPLIQEIKSLISQNKYDGLINCTDAEREGQNIFYSLYDYLNLKLPVLRFWASDLTEDKLIYAWNHLLDDLEDPMLTQLTSAALYRAELDWLVGMNFTRVVSVNNRTLIPVGRVMSVVLSMLAQREEEIANFKPSTSYGVNAKFKEGFTGSYKEEDNNSNATFKTEKEAKAFVAQLSKQGLLQEITVKNSSKSAPLLYSLGDLQNDANKEYNYTLAQSLQIIQGLYEKKILSYPRTDSPYLTTGEAKRLDVILEGVRCLPELSNIPTDSKKIAQYVKSKYVDDSKVQAHYAIVFTGSLFDPDSLSKPEINILNLVGKRILATLMDDSKRKSITAKVEIDGNVFGSIETILTDAGWEGLYGKKSEDCNSTIEKLKKGQTIHVNDYDIVSITTTCPPRYNDASINKAMINVGSTLEDETLKKVLKGNGSKDQGGIGTPATRSGIIEKLVSKRKDGTCWVERKGKSFYVTKNGMDVAQALKPYVISSPILTAQWESKLGDIACGKMQGETFKKEMLTFIKGECEKLKSSKLNSPSAYMKSGGGVKEIVGLKCPYCGNPMMESEKYYYCSEYKKEKDCKFILGKITAGCKMNYKDISQLITTGETEFKKFKNKEKKQFIAALMIDDKTQSICFKFKPSESEPVGKCGCGHNIFLKKSKKGDRYYQCEGCKKFVMQWVSGHKVSVKECEALFDGKSVIFNDCTSKAGKMYSAKFTMNDQNKLIMEFE